MKLKNVFRIEVTCLSTVANKLLENGWKLLLVTTYADTDDRYLESGAKQNSLAQFVLGATKEVALKFPAEKAKERRF